MRWEYLDSQLKILKWQLSLFITYITTKKNRRVIIYFTNHIKSTNRFIVQNSLSNIKDTKNFIIINVVNYYYYY